MRFVSVDVETANPDLGSICQIGLVVFEGGVEVDSWVSLVNPHTWFHWMNEDIHGINEHTVRRSPAFCDVFPSLSQYLAGSVVVSHTAFDKSSITKATLAAHHPPIDCRWLDSARVARRTWEQFAYSGYGLANLAEHVGFQFRHHDALEDARAAGKVLLAALEHSGKSLEEWLAASHRPICGTYANAIKLEGNPSGTLFGEEVVFTGALSVPRREMATIAASAGCKVSTTVSKKTTSLLVVGVQDPTKLKGEEISSKQRKAEELIKQGRPIRIITEADFVEMLK